MKPVKTTAKTNRTMNNMTVLSFFFSGRFSIVKPQYGHELTVSDISLPHFRHVIDDIYFLLS